MPSGGRFGTGAARLDGSRGDDHHVAAHVLYHTVRDASQQGAVQATAATRTHDQKFRTVVLHGTKDARYRTAGFHMDPEARCIAALAPHRKEEASPYKA